MSEWRVQNGANITGRDRRLGHSSLGSDRERLDTDQALDTAR
jgi:hypothetical protein